jgi:DNA-binding NarL/FixJ family response regulator
MTEPHTIRVMVVDDHPLMRSCIAGKINAQQDMRVVVEASYGAEAINPIARIGLT